MSPRQDDKFLGPYAPYGQRVKRNMAVKHQDTEAEMSESNGLSSYNFRDLKSLGKKYDTNSS